MTTLPKCSVDDCKGLVSKAGFKLCLDHWRLENKKEPIKETVTNTDQYLTATKLGELLNISSRALNQVFSELTWIEKIDTGWQATDLGKKLKAQVKTAANKQTYLIWPQSITTSNILKKAIREFLDTKSELLKDESVEIDDVMTELINRKPGHFCSMDGHWVHSRGELEIDNWLYHHRVVHVHERMLPIEENVRSDFYIPQGNVYIEYWGIENNQKYLERKKVKKEIYKQNNFNLIELENKHIENLDDNLPKLLLKFGVKVN